MRIYNFEDLHRDLWDWIVDTKSRRKCTWPRLEENGGDIPYVAKTCFACQVDLILNIDDCIDCRRCPIGDCDPCYGMWADSSDLRAAKIVRDLPWNGPKLFTYENGEWKIKEVG